MIKLHFDDYFGLKNGKYEKVMLENTIKIDIFRIKCKASHYRIGDNHVTVKKITNFVFYHQRWKL